MTVVSVLRNVNQTVLGIRRRSDAQNIVVEFTLKYERAGSGNSQALLNQIRTVGARNISYAPKHLVLAKSDEALDSRGARNRARSLLHCRVT